MDDFMQPVEMLSPQAWNQDPNTHHLMEVFENSSITARFVGGCVRDGLLNRPVSDVDIAVDVPPDEVIRVLTSKQIKTIPTGIEHGTVTAVLDHHSYQITSLRADIETDGRHAKVEFTKDWEQDAARRDFTINALYADKDGRVYDPCKQGLSDLRQGHVRFIGNPLERIEEDSLRILRFFRFSAYYAIDSLDPISFKACVILANRLTNLSAERIQYEIQRLFQAPNPTAIFNQMNKVGLLKILFPFMDDFNSSIKRLDALQRIDSALRLPPSALCRFVALFLSPEGDQVCQRLKFSRKLEGKFKEIYTHALSEPKIPPSVFDVKKNLYLKGPGYVQALYSLLASQELMQETKSIDDILKWLKPTITLTKEWHFPEFPLKGDDLLKVGIPQGPAIADTLEKTQDWWIHQNFKPDKNACLHYLRTLPTPQVGET